MSAHLSPHHSSDNNRSIHLLIRMERAQVSTSSFTGVSENASYWAGIGGLGDKNPQKILQSPNPGEKCLDVVHPPNAYASTTSTPISIQHKPPTCIGHLVGFPIGQVASLSIGQVTNKNLPQKRLTADHSPPLGGLPVEPCWINLAF